MAARLPVFYACDNCPAYCCTYARIGVNGRDLRRLACHFDLDETTAARRYTKAGTQPGERVLRHRFDEVFGSACIFLDPERRSCTVYHARPTDCRRYPGSSRCGYYDFLAAERARQDDPSLVVSAWVADL